jgi:hypothetical protein
MSARQWQGRKANRNEPGSLEVNQTAAVKAGLWAANRLSKAALAAFGTFSRRANITQWNQGVVIES